MASFVGRMSSGNLEGCARMPEYITTRSVRPSRVLSGLSRRPCLVLSVPGTPVTITESFTVDVPLLDQTSVDFGLLVDVSSSYL